MLGSAAVHPARPCKRHAKWSDCWQPRLYRTRKQLLVAAGREALAARPSHAVFKAGVQILHQISQPRLL